MSAQQGKADGGGDAQIKVSFFPAWCKGCGNCVAFCPRGALAMDQSGRPYLAKPERCTRCGLCEMLCPDFAISVSDTTAQTVCEPQRGMAAGPVNQSPERLAPVDQEG